MTKDLKYRLIGLSALWMLPALVSGQVSDLSAIYPRADATVSQLLFTKKGSSFSQQDAFRARASDLADTHSHLTVSGDFAGDGLDEIALFEDLVYQPNSHPDYTRSVVRIMRSKGDQFLPRGTWFFDENTNLDFGHVDFTVAADFNLDGYSDIALFYNNPASDDLEIYVLESNGSEFEEARSWYSCQRNDFNFTALKFACKGDFNGNGRPDMAVFYDYFGGLPETRQSIFLFESDGDSFELLPVVFESTKAEFDFSDVKFAAPGVFNPDGFSDLAVCMSDPGGMNFLVQVFEGSASGQFSLVSYYSAPHSELDPDQMKHAVSFNYAEDEVSDLCLFYDNPGSGSQEILILESTGGSFNEPVVGFTRDPGDLLFSELTSVVSGHFAKNPVVSATTWKDHRKGALSFTFDDGYIGAFQHGGAELDAAGLKGTFYIFTDTTLTYEGEIAGSSLVRDYKNRGHEIGSHSSNHSDLGWLSANGYHDSLSLVLSESVDLLNERFDQSTLSLSIPYGSFTPGTLDSISLHFLSARSSQQGFNLATPYDYFALKSLPVLSTTSPVQVDQQVALAENYGYYLPLMFHDLTDVPFDEQTDIYTYARDKFRESVSLVVQRNVWIDTHQNIYKYIRMRNSLKIDQLDMGQVHMQPGSFSFVADDGLADSLFNLPLTLLIRIPDVWTADSATVESGDQFQVQEILQDNHGAFIYYHLVPSAGHTLRVHEGRIDPTRVTERKLKSPENRLEAYPNPFRHNTLIRIHGGLSNGMLILRDLHGRQVWETTLPSHETEYRLNHELVPGVYILQLIDSGNLRAAIRLLVN